MPPRISVQPSLKALAGSFHGQNPLVGLSNATNTTLRTASTKAKPKSKNDFFRMAQARQRKAANLSRQKVLQAEREASLGDPVESKPTPFIQEIQSLQNGTRITSSSDGLNHYLKPKELNRALHFSKDLAEPLQNPDRDTADPQLEKNAAELHGKEHRNAEEAIRRIVNLSNGNNKDRLRQNVQKCIDHFGRHRTDSVLPPKPSGLQDASNPAQQEKPTRIGPDTGSPEVQAAILTVKIMNLTRHLETTVKDKHNKRNLQILVHKRQKLLRYVRKKERGGPRWQNLMETLGLSEAAWKGQIAI